MNPIGILISIAFIVSLILFMIYVARKGPRNSETVNRNKFVLNAILGFTFTISAIALASRMAYLYFSHKYNVQAHLYILEEGAMIIAILEFLGMFFIMRANRS